MTPVADHEKPGMTCSVNEDLCGLAMLHLKGDGVITLSDLAAEMLEELMPRLEELDRRFWRRGSLHRRCHR
jgi:hypothetical protein